MRIRPIFALLPALLLAACSAQTDGGEEDLSKTGEDDFTSNQATLLDFEFDGQVTATSVFNAQSLINDQMLYTIGQLNGSKAVGRLDRLALTNVQKTTADGKTTIKYHAKLPVAWGTKTNLPASYELILPADASFEGQEAFTKEYLHSCVDFGAHDVDAGSMWYYYRPARNGCQLKPADVQRFTAKVTPSTENSTGRYPEYNKVWEDGALNVVAIFGKYEDGKTSGDAGIDAYNRFVREARGALGGAVTTVPETVPQTPGVGTPDVTINATLPDGKKVSITALLVDNVRTADARFNERYNALSTDADLIVYGGHAGLGQNVRALAQKGTWKAGKYVIVFMNGCDTFAYVDGSLAQTRARINPDDPTGTKYMEFVTNALPAFFSEMPNSALTMIKGLLRHDSPMTYEQIFTGIDDSQVVVVTGEEDNTFKPADAPPPAGWQGVTARVDGLARAAERRFDTGVVQPGRYEFKITGTGDADLYVKVGAAVGGRVYDCRPYKSGSTETCVVTVRTAANISSMVRGYAATSSVEYSAKKL
ncbi:MAG: hypothetical protein IPQ09_26550 [Myxococcales bacterium]|nr:hypothetical protein [Myxococcales bacterium]HQY63732.1 hypothetical protein [Polyangiaceae bacterium]